MSRAPSGRRRRHRQSGSPPASGRAPGRRGTTRRAEPPLPRERPRAVAWVTNLIEQHAGVSIVHASVGTPSGAIFVRDLTTSIGPTAPPRALFPAPPPPRVRGRPKPGSAPAANPTPDRGSAAPTRGVSAWHD